MARKDKVNFQDIKPVIPEYYIDPLKSAVFNIERVIINSGLTYNMEYRPDDGYFSLELYGANKEK
jgi:hypothetical protein